MSSGTINYADMFHNKLLDFTDDLTCLCPEMSEIKLMRKALQTEFPFTKRDIHKIFKEHVVIPFGDHIQSKDEQFFLTDADYSSHMNQVNVSDSFNLINHIKQVWSSLSQTNKDIIWKHLYLLVKLNEKN